MPGERPERRADGPQGRGGRRGQGAAGRGKGGDGGRGRRDGERRDGERRDGERRDGERRGGRETRREERPAGGRATDERERRARDAELPVPPEITGDELDDDVRAELNSLSKGAAIAVARHLVMSAHLLDEDPELAYQHALAARRRAARVGVVREAAGIAAYSAGRYAEALAELRAARRITGSADYLPMMADCERGLGRPRRALDLAADPAATGLDVDQRVEMLIVAAGARRDLGDVAAAVVSLQVPELRSQANRPWVARLRYAYADMLEAAGRRDEARQWFLRAIEADHEEDTDAAERVAALDAQSS